MEKLKENFNILKTHRINPYLHSVFGEYFGNVIYDGTWVGKDSDIPNIEGIRKDVIEGLKMAGVKAIRWPGGCCADHYHWKDGIGKVRKKRQPFSKAQLGEWKNDFGTDEFLKLCNLTDAEPIIVVNVASGTPQEFLDWYEYCNGSTDTKYGSLRAENGHPEPYGVKIWGIGNTDENVWHITNNNPEEYAANFLKWQTVLRGYRDDIKLIGLGLSHRHGIQGWVERFLDYVTYAKQHLGTVNQAARVKGPDSLSVHHYIWTVKFQNEHAKALHNKDLEREMVEIQESDSINYSDEEYYMTLDALKEYKKDIELHRKYIEEHTNPKYKTTICFDEWGLWHPEATLDTGIRQRQTMRDGIFAACTFHLFYRNSDIVEYAMETQYSNILQSLFETKGKNFHYTPTFYVFKLFKEHLGQYLLNLDLESSNPYIDILASSTEDYQRITLSVVNKHLHKDCKIMLPPILNRYNVAGADIIAPANIRDINTYSATKISNESLEIVDSITLPKHSIARIIFTK